MATDVMHLRAAEPDELDRLARLWHDAWYDAHDAIAPAGLVAARTVARFRERLPALLADTRVAGPLGRPLGLCVIKDDRLDQLFVARQARGKGVAAALLADGEARLARRGIATAWLACAIGNDRAARFYEKHGWVNARTFTDRLDAGDAVYEVAVWRFEKAVRR